MIEWIIMFLLLFSSLFMLLAALGILRLPDLPTRMHASTKAGALGAILVMTAAALFFSDSLVVTKAIAVILFILITAPIAAHAIGRAGYFVGVPMWEGSVKDELQANYDPKTHRLLSGLETAEELEIYRKNLDIKPRIKPKRKRNSDF
ncbi:monovalent cation/H(+) antiporter subunit G [Marinospirillum sp. MEB164]|uniref:Monovalent cation/H(+) antiporter subunit G n=1 Tax=Marinospirillum alkalitolerans TaxID=3123374 RepID=A0ABW8PZP8_9GAMM